MGVKKYGDKWRMIKRWPDGRQIQRRFEAKTPADALLARIELSIALGNWREFRDDLMSDRSRVDPTVEGFFPQFLTECAANNRRPDFHEQAGTSIIAHLGGVRVTAFSKADAYHYIEERRREKVAPATINRGLAVIKRMLSYALEIDLIEAHPLHNFRLLPEPQQALEVPTPEEVALVLKHASDEFQPIATLVAETGFRLSEARFLKWSQVDLSSAVASVGRKSGKIRHVPLSRAAIDALRSTTRAIGSPWVFTVLGNRQADLNGKPWGEWKLSAALREACHAAEVKLRGFHDLRHYRASLWVRNGVDLRTVQELLGHASIQTTMRYAHFSPSHALEAVRRAEKIERERSVKRVDFA